MNNHHKTILDSIHGKLIVSCQALSDEPLHSSYIMSKMALAASIGGAGGIRANSVEDIHEIRKEVNLPIIGIIKQDYPDSPVYITPTMKEVDALMNEGVEIMALDATNRIRPGGMTLDAFFHQIKGKYPDQLLMADCSTFEECAHACKLGFDLIGTTMNGYTEDSISKNIPPLKLMEMVADKLPKPLIAEGHLDTPALAAEAMHLGAWAVVVGSAITRPQLITKRFAEEINKAYENTDV